MSARPASRLAAIALAEIVSLLALLGIAGADRYSGRTLFSITATHGVHLGDLLVGGLWAAGIALCVLLWRLP